MKKQQKRTRRTRKHNENEINKNIYQQLPVVGYALIFLFVAEKYTLKWKGDLERSPQTWTNNIYSSLLSLMVEIKVMSTHNQNKEGHWTLFSIFFLHSFLTVTYFVGGGVKLQIFGSYGRIGSFSQLRFKDRVHHVQLYMYCSYGQNLVSSQE